MKALVTGAHGFIGSALTAALRQAGWQVVEAVRCPRGSVDEAVVGDIDGQTRWQAALQGCDTVVHLAARVHVMRDTATDPLAVFRAVNTDGTLNLARQAAQAGVRRFVFLSSIKVNGEASSAGRPFRADDPSAPEDAYAVSKREAEDGLLTLARQTGLEVVIIRPPLVYGPGVKANFRSMMDWLAKGIPLPLGAVHNRRSLVSLTNLVDLIVTCLRHPAAANQVFLVADGEDVSTTELLRRTGHALGRPARLLPVPAGLLAWGAGLLGKADVARRLCSNLQVDISKTRTMLGWQPPLGLDEGLRRATAAYWAERARQTLPLHT